MEDLLVESITFLLAYFSQDENVYKKNINHQNSSQSEKVREEAEESV